MHKARQCWVLSDGKAGNDAHSFGLATFLDCDVVAKRFQPRLPWAWLPPHAWVAPFAAVKMVDQDLAPPWPDLVIGSGRMTAPLTAAVRKASGGGTYAVQIQDSRLDPRRFDLVVVPQHDHLRGDNVLVSLGALNRITPALLAAEAERFAPQFADLPRPLVAVLIGGNSRAYRMTRSIVERLAGQLSKLVADGAGLLVTLSRRSGPEAATHLRQTLTGPSVWFWDGEGENPFLGFLGSADHIVATCDSVNMVSEAATTGKPVHLVEMKGGTPRSRRFQESFRSAGITRPFDGALTSWHYEPLQETARIAAEIAQRLDARGAQST